MDTYKFIPKKSLEFECVLCEYITDNKKDYSKHLLTSKHYKLTNNLQYIPKIPKNQNQKYICKCGKEYSHRQSLYTHNKKCAIQINPTSEENSDENVDYKMIYELFKIQLHENKELKDILLQQHKQNSELQSKVLEICKNGTHNITNTNSNNKSFNLNFFLNETCKDAMNIMDFVDSVKLQLSDLENVGKIGYVEGISNIIVKNLNSLDESKRPVHCTDTKREIMYIKDENKWEKENKNKQKIRKAIKHIAHKNSKMLKEFKNKHPDCDKSDSRFSDQYNNIVIEALGGKGDNDLEKEDKIIRNIAKEVTIDKNID
jgi:hypothetical protein